MSSSNGEGSFPPIVEINVGGVFYTTSLSTLTKDPDSLLGQMFTGKTKQPLLRDSKGKYFIDRDGVLFRYVLDYLRNDNKLVLPESFHEKNRLKSEAEFYVLPGMVKCVDGRIIADEAGLSSLTLNQSSLSPLLGKPAYITIGYRGSFAFGREGLASDVKFRKLTRILVCGRINVCREVFGDTLNESRDPDRGSSDRYTSRFFLKHTYLEQAFDMLQDAGFKCVSACGTGTTSGQSGEPMKPGVDSEENKWQHYNEFVFVRP